MATDQDESTSTDQSGINYSAADCDNLKANFAATLEIRAQDIITLLNYYDDFRSHTHEITDLAQKDGFFGNLAGDQTVSNTENTGEAAGMNGTPGDPIANVSEITAPYHAALRDAFNSIRTHYHQWDDRTSTGETENNTIPPPPSGGGGGEIP